MTEIRQNPLSGEWVVIAIERAMRPENFSQKSVKEVKANKCPFCLGHESMTPPEVYALRPGENKPDSPGWKIRVVPNLYPAFRLDSEIEDNQDEVLFKKMGGIGQHEVIIHSPDHNKHLARLNIDKIETILKTYQKRYVAAAHIKQVRYISIIINHGQEAGASLEHPHSQLFAIPLIPSKIENELKNFQIYKEKNDECLLCRIRLLEEDNKERLVLKGKNFTVIAPFAARVPFELMVIPDRHNHDINDLKNEEIHELAGVLKDILLKLEKILNNPPYNLYVHNSPVEGDYQFFHWHISIRPKLTIPAGFEMSTEVMINVMKPEDTAKYLQ